MIEYEDKAPEIVTTDMVTKKIKGSLGNGRGTLLLAIFGVLVSLCSSFMFCLASIGFDFSQLTNSVFWSRWAALAVASFVAYAIVILHKDEMNRKNDWYVENMRKIAEKASETGEAFEVYLQQLNLKRRIEWYKRHINDKIAALNAKVLQYELKNKPTDKLKAQIALYTSRLSEDFIERNKYALKTRSKPISSVQVLSETNRGDNGETTFRSASAYYSGKSAVKLVLSLVMTAAFSCVVVQNFAVGIDIASVVMTVLTVLSVLISVMSAIMAANGCYKNVYVPNLLFRLKILSDYDEWKKKKEEEEKKKDQGKLGGILGAKIITMPKMADFSDEIPEKCEKMAGFENG